MVMGKRENDITEAVNKAVICFGMAKILEKRLMRIDYINKKLTFMGLILPSGVGITSAKLGEFKELFVTASPMEMAIIIAVITFGIIQMIISAYSISHKWNDNLLTYRDSKSENYKNADKYYNI